MGVGDRDSLFSLVSGICFSCHGSSTLPTVPLLCCRLPKAYHTVYAYIREKISSRLPPPRFQWRFDDASCSCSPLLPLLLLLLLLLLALCSICFLRPASSVESRYRGCWKAGPGSPLATSSGCDHPLSR